MASIPISPQMVQSLKIASRNALQREGERPNNVPTRSEIIDRYTSTALSIKEGAVLAKFNVIATHYPPSVASFKDLNKIMISDLILETHHRGRYLLLRFVCPAMRLSPVMNIVEDETGSVIPFALHLQQPESVKSAESILRNQAVVILKEPYFKVETDGRYEIRIDHPTDIIWLSRDDIRVPAPWRVRDTIVSESAEYWRKKGNDQVGKGDYFEAIEM